MERPYAQCTMEELESMDRDLEVRYQMALKEMRKTGYTIRKPVEDIVKIATIVRREITIRKMGWGPMDDPDIERYENNDDEYDDNGNLIM